ncbi:MAG: Ig domain-containing protein, partial [Mycoplasmataceae bacterium]|nr:Ig domain-containing protein [Mycoplasmataceae bacterium]
MENQTEALKFQQENKKRRKRIKTALIASTLAVSVGGGVGIGYIIWYTKYANNDANVLVIKDAGNFTGNVGSAITPTHSLACTTKAGTTVKDANYSAADLPEGLEINSKSGVISGVPIREASGSYTIQVTSDE